MVCNPQGLWGKEAFGAGESRLPLQGCCPGCRLLARHCLLGKARFSQPSGAGRPPISPSTYVLFFETALWSYNSRAIPFILSKCPIQWLLGVYRIVQPSPYSILEPFHHPRKEILYLLAVPPILSSPQLLVTSNLLPGSMYLPIWTFCINGIIQHLFFCDRLLLLSRMFYLGFSSLR